MSDQDTRIQMLGDARRALDLARYRTLAIAVFFTGLTGLGGALILYSQPGAGAIIWLPMLVLGLASLGLYPFIRRASHNIDRLHAYALAVLTLAAFMVLHALIYSTWIRSYADPDSDLFRPIFAFIPFLYLACVALLPAQRGILLSWAIFAGQLAITLPSLWLHGGENLSHDGAVALLVWLILANPLFILLLGALPRYESALSESQRVAQDLAQMAYHDPLTGLHNRRYFDDQILRECERARRNKHPVSLILVDLDHFKLFNDHYGHAAGDECLVELAAMISQSLRRPGDLVVRYGGEEFAAILPETDVNGAMHVAQRIIDTVRAARLPHAGSPEGIVTASAGVTTADDQAPAYPSMMFDEADQALYGVKSAGRNDYAHYRPGATETAGAAANG